MASSPSFVAYVCEQMAQAGEIRWRKMFGEYGIYCNDKIVALVCDDQLFVKPTEAGRALLAEPVLLPPYPQGTPMFWIDAVDDAAFLSALIAATEQALPPPKPRRKRKTPQA